MNYIMATFHMNNYLGQLITKDKTGTEILGEKIKFEKKEGGEEYQIAWNFIHPCIFT